MPGGWMEVEGFIKPGTVEGWIVGKVLGLLGVEGVEGGRIPYWASHGLFGGRDLKWERGEEMMLEYQEDWIDWRLGREERSERVGGVGGGGRRRDVLALSAGGWAPERGMTELCGGFSDSDERKVPNLVVNVRRPLLDVVLWREWIAGGGGEGNVGDKGKGFDDVKFLRSVVGIFKKWRAVGESEGDKADGLEVLELEMDFGGTEGIAELVQDIAETIARILKRRKGDLGKWAKGVEEITRRVVQVENEFATWKANYIAQQGVDWVRREEKILKSFKSFILREGGE
ncbi:hypothetical protein TrVE_jg10278 [Triparma verrucosa]|uniref:Uncharacterized protein n=1 Tax=Triparma verrucosa TaxID=1606542 RepID=A0A9W7C3Y7_9STRA|nr:hypothetical protein TrVE_jg10278 [Triparma verrucosa]